MLVILPIALYLIASAASLVMRWWKPKFRFGWIIAVVASLLAAGIVLFWGMRLPLLSSLTDWGLPGLEPLSISLLADHVSWAYALSVAALVLAALIAESLYNPSTSSFTQDVSDWPIAVGLSGLAFIPLLAENTFTILIGWSVLDIFELIARVLRAPHEGGRQRNLFFITSRLISLILVIAAGMIIRSDAPAGGPETNAGLANLILLVAAAWRVLTIPCYFPNLGTSEKRRPLDLLLVLASAASSMMIFTRLAVIGVSAEFSVGIFMLITLLAAFFGLAWLILRDGEFHVELLIGGAACLELAASAGGHPDAALAWGVASLLVTGLISFYVVRMRWLAFIALLAWIGFSALPLTPTWAGTGAYDIGLTGVVSFLAIGLLLIAQALMMTGILLAARHPRPGVFIQERWASVVYPIALILLPAVQWLLFLSSLPAIIGGRIWTDLLLRSWPSIAATALSLALFYIYRRTGRPWRDFLAPLHTLFSLRWLISISTGIYRSTKRLVGFIDLLSDGDGGILWTLLFLILMFALLVQLRSGS